MRLTAAVNQLGISRKLFLAEVASGRIQVRMRALGQRGLLHASFNDVARAEQALNGTTASKGAAQ